MFNLKKSCESCPFLKDTAARLGVGFVDKIEKVLRDDHDWFICHSTLSQPKKEQQQCYGHTLLSYSVGRMNIAQRFALMTKQLDLKNLSEDERNKYFLDWDSFKKFHTNADPS